MKERYQDDSAENIDNSFHGQRRTLAKNICAIRDVQRLYMSGVDHLLDGIDLVLITDHPENVQLWLPSDLPQPSRDNLCVPGLASIEYHHRYAAAVDAIQDMRRFLQFSQAIITKTQSHISNTQKTRNNSQTKKVRQKIAQAAATYRVCRSAISKLSPNEEFGPWKEHLRELTKEDLRGPVRGDSETSESRHRASWIWTTPALRSRSTDKDSEDLHAVLRVEWCKAQEQASRWEEEVELVVEEMRRTLVYFKWLARKWEERATLQRTPTSSSTGADNVTAAGISAYAHKQAALYRKLVDIFVNDWYPCLKKKSPPWLEEYPAPPPAKRGCLVSNVKRYHGSSAPPSDPSGDSESEDDGDEKEERDEDLEKHESAVGGDLFDFADD